MDDRLCDDLAAKLADLAGGCASAADVAAKLAEAGCKGEREDCYECPVAKWLLVKLPGPRLTVHVGAYDASAQWESAETADDPGAVPVYDVEVTADMPAVLTAVVLGFDDGDFAELEPATAAV